MKHLGKRITYVLSAIVGCLLALPVLVQAQEIQEAPAQNLGDQPSPRTVHDEFGAVAHLFLNPHQQAIVGAATGPLIYHSGGSVMVGPVTIYDIFWVPPHLQNGAATSLPASYQSLMNRFAGDYPAHGIDNNNTQYYQTTSGTSYIRNAGAFGGSYIDTQPYPAPASGCTDTVTPGNCLSLAQVGQKLIRLWASKAGRPG